MGLKLAYYSVSAVFLAFLGVFLLSAGHPVRYAVTADPLIILIVIAGALTIASFVFGMIFDEYSWVDRIWSIAPVIYSWVLALRGWPDERLILVAIMITLWGARLTFNFARKGGYSGVEDYRWAYVRKTFPNNFLWQLFNFGFISLYQNALILLFTLPAYLAYQYKGKPQGTMDQIVTIIFILFLIFETIADQQQWQFHQKKKKGKAKTKFLTEGLFKYSRHPNYFAEVSLWWIVYVYGVIASGQWLNWTIIGAALLTVLFQGSSILTETISKSKYKDYAKYQKRTSKIFPWFPRGVFSGK